MPTYEIAYSAGADRGRHRRPGRPARQQLPADHLPRRRRAHDDRAARPTGRGRRGLPDPAGYGFGGDFEGHVTYGLGIQAAGRTATRPCRSGSASWSAPTARTSSRSTSDVARVRLAAAVADVLVRGRRDHRADLRPSAAGGRRPGRASSPPTPPAATTSRPSPPPSGTRPGSTPTRGCSAGPRRTFDVLTAEAADGVPGVTMRPTRMLIRGRTTDAVVGVRRAGLRGRAGASGGSPCRPSRWARTWTWLDRCRRSAAALRRRGSARFADLADAAGGGQRHRAGRRRPRRRPGRPPDPRPGRAGRQPGPDHVGPRRGPPGRAGLRAPAQPATSCSAAPSSPATTDLTARPGDRGGDPAPVRRRWSRSWPARGCSGTGRPAPGPARRPARRGGPGRTAGGTRLIHAYGHGGAGMTLSWGCADEVVRLALS